MQKLTLNYKTNQPETTYKAIKPELQDSPSRRSQIKIQKNKNTIKLKIKSKDKTSLRAATNSWLRWIMIADETTQKTKNK
ncbi:KEOPS complex subunit Pcc1 [Methanonatronarchaeum sp. AMET6-2]|uniref:KEOPS complex subunit Pcc1 n=1 Tax=Methanonatronarchaeum sp. AMET6-2 TaxID=2933293 RepID=UPI0011F94B8B|nr:KEOPS complex subunit Pcc1 [Methanonatronarchaeum sp. AMET6-2]RZN63070.1 MAG: hypothetical protein EF811_01250 [Methanonatronarchaeia archaeon]UOY09596.1 hypothetical protein MU439_04905 [Methanonatronarchaeum sp. AMET6-2]